MKAAETVRRSGGRRLQGHVLLSATVMDLGGIIGLLSSMHSMHF